MPMTFKFVDLRVGTKVEDCWWPWTHRGVIVTKLKTQVRVKMVDGRIVTYDKAHATQFLRPMVTA